MSQLIDLAGQFEKELKTQINLRASDHSVLLRHITEWLHILVNSVNINNMQVPMIAESLRSIIAGKIISFRTLYISHPTVLIIAEMYKHISLVGDAFPHISTKGDMYMGMIVIYSASLNNKKTVEEQIEVY
jgi:hypothetical protein